LPSQLILDFDGTLIDSGPAVLETFAASLRAHGIAPQRPLARDLIGPPLHATLQTLTGISDKSQLEVLAAEFRKRYDTDGLYATAFYPGIPELLQAQLAAGRRLHLATNKRQKPTLLLLEHFGWLPWFTSIYCVDSRVPPFPSKGEMLRVQLREQQLDAADCVYVGDTRHDEVAAAEAGIAFVAAGWGYGSGAQAVSAGARMLAAPADLVF
jgi:phosphoglycolate phosphatase